MNWRKSIAVLAILMATVAAIVLSQMDFPAYSTEGITEELTDLCSTYTRLREQHATNAEWRALAEDARRRTEPLIADMDGRSSLCKAGNRPLYQLAKHALPRAIESQGNTPPADLEQWLKQSHDELQPASVAKRATAQRRQSGRNDADGGIDWITVGMVVFDLALLVGLGYMFLKPYVGRAKRAPLAEDKESLLRTLDREIAQDPESARHRGIRAKLLVEMGRREEALADIDWIIDTEPHGADLITWHELRESLTHEHTEEKRDAEHGQ
jgi:hypothetical protein